MNSVFDKHFTCNKHITEFMEWDKQGIADIGWSSDTNRCFVKRVGYSRQWTNPTVERSCRSDVQNVGRRLARSFEWSPLSWEKVKRETVNYKIKFKIWRQGAIARNLYGDTDKICSRFCVYRSQMKWTTRMELVQNDTHTVWSDVQHRSRL